MTITFSRTATGQFEAIKDGATTGYAIVNGSAGLTGRDTRNMYGVCRTGGKVVWVGSLHSAKALVTAKLAGKL